MIPIKTHQPNMRVIWTLYNTLLPVQENLTDETHKLKIFQIVFLLFDFSENKTQ